MGFSLLDFLVVWPSGLGNGLQNRLQRFDSACDLWGSVAQLDRATAF